MKFFIIVFMSPSLIRFRILRTGIKGIQFSGSPGFIQKLLWNCSEDDGGRAGWER